MSAGREFAQVLNWLPSSALDEVEEHLRSRPGRYAMVDGQAVQSEQSLFGQFGAEVFVGAKVANWAQFEDHLHQAIGAQPELAVVWLSVDNLLAAQVPLLVEACDLFYGRARWASSVGKRFRVFLLGEGPNFSQAQ
ncbi:MAG TPA: hypothetical protein VFN61_12540 [Acidimicrobiales bacterium]|nr:hypothetical protein [Acidimicrobiales bacterium]